MVPVAESYERHRKESSASFSYCVAIDTNIRLHNQNLPESCIIIAHHLTNINQCFVSTFSIDKCLVK